MRDTLSSRRHPKNWGRVGLSVVISFVLMILVILVVGLVALDRLERLNGSLQNFSTLSLPKLDMAWTALDYSVRNNRITMKIFLLDDPHEIHVLLDERARNAARITQLYSRIAQRLRSPEESRLFEAVKSARVPYVESDRRALALLVDEKDFPRARRVMITQTLPAIAEYHAALERFEDFETARMIHESNQANEETATAKRTLDALISTAVLLTLGIAAVMMALILGQVAKRRAAEKQLQASNEALERQVTERTAELAGANQSLEAEIAERERVHAERNRLSAFSTDVGAALTRSESFSIALTACADAYVRHLGASLASIWVLNPREMVLERKAMVGAVSNSPEPFDRIPVGQSRVGRIAAGATPCIVDLTCEPTEDDDRWSLSQGMVSFAGYPLTVEGRCVGVMSMSASAPIPESVLGAMANVADAIALGIERERAAESLSASEGLTRSVIDGMLDGLITVDSQSVIKSVNPAAEVIFGYSREELLGKPLALLMPESQAANAMEFLRAARAKALGRVTNWQGRRKSGETFPFELALFEFWTSQGRHLAGAIKDLSERQEVDRLKREFVSTVSHELRTPLTSIRGAIGLICGGAAGTISEKAKGLAEIALKNCERLSRLVNDILDIEKIESGQVVFRMEELELGPLLEATVAANSAYADQYGVRLEIENAAPGARVLVDADRFTQAVTNLISNAVKFSPSKGTVRLVTRSEKGVVRLEIIDRGPGIPDEFRSRIFARFQQADSSDTRRKGGTGLGLAITRLIVERLSGSIGFETQLGTGTTFWIELHDFGQLRDLPRSPVAFASASRRFRVLHVDDDKDLSDVLAAALDESVDLDIARSLREAQERLATEHYDLVILDMSLPDGSGLELRHQLEDPAGLKTPFVLFTAQEVSSNAAGSASAIHIKSRGSVEQLVKSVKAMLGSGSAEALKETA